MSEEQKIDKTKLPTKTKIAVWWLAAWTLAAIPVMAIVGAIFFASGPLEGTAAGGWAVMFCILALMVAEILVFLPVIFLSMKRTWSLPVSGTMLVVYVALNIIWVFSHLTDAMNALLSFIPGIILLVPLVLIIVDRKNYFEMLRQLYD